ncbi:MAG: hypothetical protein WCF94_04340 [bacterium]
MYFQKQSPEVETKNHTSNSVFWVFSFIIGMPAIYLFFSHEMIVGCLILLSVCIIFPPLDNYLKIKLPYLRIPNDAKAYAIYVILISATAIVYNQHFVPASKAQTEGTQATSTTSTITATTTPKTTTRPCIKNARGCVRR